MNSIGRTAPNGITPLPAVGNERTPPAPAAGWNAGYKQVGTQAHAAFARDLLGGESGEALGADSHKWLAEHQPADATASPGPR
jgi:hypothetical protein